MPGVNIITPKPAEKERSHTRSAASIARSLHAKRERDRRKQEEEEQMEAMRKQERGGRSRSIAESGGDKKTTRAG